MVSAERAGGARELHLPDWPFGAVGRRLLLEALLLDHQPKQGWTKSALEKRAGVSTGGLDEVLAGAVELGLITAQGGRWTRGDPLPPIARPLKQVLRATKHVPDEPIPPLPQTPLRPYALNRFDSLVGARQINEPDLSAAAPFRPVSHSAEMR